MRANKARRHQSNQQVKPQIVYTRWGEAGRDVRSGWLGIAWNIKRANERWERWASLKGLCDAHMHEKICQWDTRNWFTATCFFSWASHSPPLPISLASSASLLNCDCCCYLLDILWEQVPPVCFEVSLSLRVVGARMVGQIGAAAAAAAAWLLCASSALADWKVNLVEHTKQLRRQAATKNFDHKLL